MGCPYTYYPSKPTSSGSNTAKDAAQKAANISSDASEALTGDINADLAVLAVAIDRLHASMKNYAEEVTQTKATASNARSEAYSARVYAQQNTNKLRDLQSEISSVTKCVGAISSNLTAYKNTIVSGLNANKATVAEKAEVITNDISGVQNAIHDVDDLLNKHTILLNTLYSSTAGLKPTLDDLVYRYTILQADLNLFSNRFDEWVDELGSQLNDVRDDLVNHMSTHAQSAHEERLALAQERSNDEIKTRNTGALVVGTLAALFSLSHMLRKVRCKTPKVKAARVTRARDTVVVESE